MKKNLPKRNVAQAEAIKAKPAEPYLTLTRVAAEMGCTRETTRRRLADIGLSTENITLRSVVRAFAPDYATAENPKDRLALAQAIKVERENRVEEGELVPLSEVEKEIAENVVHPTRTWVTDQPSRIATRCNPEHPEIAALALKQDGDELLKILRDKLPKDLND